MRGLPSILSRFRNTFNKFTNTRGRMLDSIWERSCSLVECLTGDRASVDWSLTCITVLWSSARHINPSLVLVQPWKILSYITEKLLMGGKESNQTS